MLHSPFLKENQFLKDVEQLTAAIQCIEDEVEQGCNNSDNYVCLIMIKIEMISDSLINMSYSVAIL